MRQVAKRGILTAVATGSVLASASGYAYASSDAQGAVANSPGVGSGNNIQAPVDIPVNACGNTVSVVGLLNPAMGNDCANSSGPGKGAETRGAEAHGSAGNSPGVASGNNIHAPVSVPINACGNSVNVVGVGNPAFGNDCGNVATPPPPAQDEDCHPGTHNPPPPASTQPPGTTPPRARAPAPVTARAEAACPVRTRSAPRRRPWPPPRTPRPRRPPRPRWHPPRRAGPSWRRPARRGCS
ncbi:chaplin [Kitasatospora gansuensis]